jgi:hypothetical protein
MQTTINGAVGIELVVPTHQECVTFPWKTANECFMKRIDVAAVPRVSNPTAHAPSIREMGGSK